MLQNNSLCLSISMITVWKWNSTTSNLVWEKKPAKESWTLKISLFGPMEMGKNPENVPSFRMAIGQQIEMLLTNPKLAQITLIMRTKVESLLRGWKECKKPYSTCFTTMLINQIFLLLSTQLCKIWLIDRKKENFR